MQILYYNMWTRTLLTLLLTVVAINAQTVYLTGDSTMAKGGGGSGSDGMLTSYTANERVLTIPSFHQVGVSTSASI